MDILENGFDCEVILISFRKTEYKDLNKWRKSVTEYNRRYYAKTALYEPRGWTDEEVEMIMAREKSDRELSEILHRSMKSIVGKRCLVKKKMERDVVTSVPENNLHRQ